MQKILDITKGKRTYVATALFIVQAIILDSGKLANIHSFGEFLAYISQLSGTPAGVLVNVALLGFGLRLALPGTPVVVPTNTPVAVPPEVKPVEAAPVVTPAPVVLAVEVKETVTK